MRRKRLCAWFFHNCRIVFLKIITPKQSHTTVLAGTIQPIRLGGAISVLFGSHYCKKDDVKFTTLLWQNNGRQNGLISRMLYNIMLNKVTFVHLRVAIALSTGSVPDFEIKALQLSASQHDQCAYTMYVNFSELMSLELFFRTVVRFKNVVR